jgi:hypothetical protein
MAQEVKKEGPKFEFHGFVGGSLYAQDAVFNSYGQGAFFAAKQPNQDKLVLGGDARQTRLNFSLAGPKVFGGAVPKAVAEVDFFSALSNQTLVTGVTTTGTPVTSVATTTTTTGPTAVTPRLRLAYAELNWGATIFRMGQTSDLIGGSFAPTTVGHIPQSVAYAAGYLGTRHLNAEVFHTLPAGDMKVELALQAKAPISGAGDAFSGLTTAEASGIPGVEARARVIMAKLADAYVMGHWSRRDKNGQNNTLNSGPLGDSQDIIIGSVGVKLTPGPLTVQGQGYVGKNAGAESFAGGIGGQSPGITGGDVHEYGAWGQIGFNLTPEFGVWGLVGTERFTNYVDARNSLGANARLANVNISAMLRYQDGGYAIGLEYLHSHTTYATVQAASLPAAPDGVLDGNQLMLSTMYFF